MIDFHNHLIPGVDDGAQTLEQSCVALTAFAQDGVRTIITTPHVNASLTRDPRLADARLAEIDRGWEVLIAHVREHHPDLALHRGVELALDAPEPAIEDARLRLAGGRFILVEFPYMTIPPRSAAVIADLCMRDSYPIIAHPERYAGHPNDNSLVQEWRRSGGFLQVNGASLLGRYGAMARRLAFGLLQRGWVDYLSSDYHARGKTGVAEYRGLLTELGGAEQALLLTETNPARILTDEPPLPVPALRVRRSLWSRVSELFNSA
jgi:protein-tyrosine phosphatase